MNVKTHLWSVRAKLVDHCVYGWGRKGRQERKEIEEGRERKKRDKDRWRERTRGRNKKKIRAGHLTRY